MKLNFEQISSVCLGAARVCETINGICMHRFTEEQEEIYKKVREDFYKQSLATAGIKLCFETDSSSLNLKVKVSFGSSRSYFSFDIMVDGKMVGSLNNYSDASIPNLYMKPIKPAEKLHAFFVALSKNYPETKIYAITPIWRKDCMETRAFGEFSRVAQDIEKIVKPLKNITCIHGYDFVPKDESYFADLLIHPNDSGFD